jgi:hypothetical protein
MPDIYDRYNISPVLTEAISNSENFGRQPLAVGDEPLKLTPGSRLFTEPTVIFGSVWTPEGLSDEMLVNPAITNSLQISPFLGSMKALVDAGLAELSEFRQGVNTPNFSKHRKRAVEGCVGRGHSVLAGIMVFHTTEREPLHTYFYARPLEEVAFAMRDDLLGFNRQQELEGCTPPSSEDIQEALNPSASTQEEIAMLMGVLFLPDSVGGDIAPLETGSSESS